MYAILEDINEAAGLGAGGEAFVNVTNAITNAANAAANIVAASKGNQSPTAGGNTYSPVVYQPPTTVQQPVQQQASRDWLPWIAGGVVALFGLYMLNKK